jgi:methionyl-tRNA formyltransferase
MKMAVPAVKQAASGLGLPVYQPERVRNGELEHWLRERNADFALVVAYGRILPRPVLQTPRRGCLNLHASLLPEFRGAAPIQWALLEGRAETGISLMQMDEGMDTGPVYAMRRLAIPAQMNGGQLTDALASLAAEMVPVELLQVVEGRLQASPQDHTRASSAPPIQRHHLGIDWSQPGRRIVQQVRAFAPQPGAFTLLQGRRLKVLEASVGARAEHEAPGSVLTTAAHTLAIACGESESVELQRVQWEGGNPQGARDVLNGRSLRAGQVLGVPEPSS